MAWYLSEVVTDLSPIREILGLYEQTGSFPEEEVIDEYQRRLVALLRETTINTDHINADAVPAAYDHDEHQWLATGYHDLIGDLGLVTPGSQAGNSEASFELTGLGTRVLKEEVSMTELMKARLPEWRNDAGIRPYPEVKKLLSELKQRNLYPCGGLLLLEVLMVLQRLNQTLGHLNLYERIQDKRIEFYPHMNGELQFDLIDYSGFLWEQMSQDLSNYHAANYPTRATLQLMMYADELIYGPVPDEIFGLVQYISVP
jgi:hypothetical protein